MYSYTILVKRQGKKMLLFEIKKVLLKPRNKAALILLAAVLIIGSILTIRDVKYVTEDGDTISGIAAAHELKRVKNEWSGDITEDVLRRVIEKHRAINASFEAKSNDTRENNKAYSKTQGYLDIKELISLAFSEFDEYDYFRANSVLPEEVGQFYDRRINGLRNYLYSDEITDTYTEEEKEFLLNAYADMEIPLYYEYAEGWRALLDSQYFPTLMMILVLVMGFLVAGIFSDEFTNKSDSIFFSTRTGRDKGVLAKIGAGFCIVTIVYWAVTIIYSLIILCTLGFEGGVCSVQTGLSNWRSFYNITYFEDFVLTVIGGYIGSLFILILAMLISAKSHSTVLAITVPFILTCIPPFLGKIAMISRVMSLFPDQLLRLNKGLEDFCLYQIGGKIMGGISVIIPIYLILFCLIIPILFMVYRKTEIH